MLTHLTFCVIFGVRGAKYNTKCDFTGRAGGARADDNFTKKPQKKLIRYIALF